MIHYNHYVPAAILSLTVSSAQNSLYFAGFDFRMVSTFDVAQKAEIIVTCSNSSVSYSIYSG